MKPSCTFRQRLKIWKVAGLPFLVSGGLTHVAFTAKAEPPGMQSQPKSQTVILYQPAAFGVIASGTAPLSYQWRKGGVPIVGATNDQIAIPQSRFSDAGRYSVVVSNAEGSATSMEVELAVNSPKGGDLDGTFTGGGSINGEVRCVAVQPNGKVLIGGDFTTVHGAVRGRIARLNPDGTTDCTFMNGLTGADASVHTVVLQNDGKVLVGGAFTTINGISRNGIARLEADGTLDSTYHNAAPGISRNFWPDSTLPRVHSMALQSDRKIVIGGLFTAVNGGPRTSIARLNADGELDLDFHPVLSGANEVYSVVVQSDGKILIAGRFDSVNAVSRRGVARLHANGTLDTTTFQDAEGFAYSFSSIALESNGGILLGGTVARRLHANGTLDRDRQLQLPFQGVSLNGVLVPSVTSVAVHADGKVLLGGILTPEKSGTLVGGFLHQFNRDGTLDQSFQNRPLALNGRVNSIVVQSDGKVLVGGDFTSVNGAGRSKIARLNADGTPDRNFENVSSGLSSSAPSYTSVSAMALHSDGKVLVAGRFMSVNGAGHTNVARLKADGTLDSGWKFSGTRSVYGVEVSALAVQPDGKVLIGGPFHEVNGGRRSGIARLHVDGSIDTAFQGGITWSNGPSVHAIAVQPDGKLLLGGAFSPFNGVSRQNIARLNADGTLDADFQNGLSGANSSVQALALQGDGKILIGGDFDTVNGVMRGGIARLNSDGTLDNTFRAGVSSPIYPAGIVTAMAVQSDRKVVVGGNFTSVNGVRRNKIVRLNSDGTLDSGFQSGLSGVSGDFIVYVRAIALQADGKALIAGDFTAINGVTRNHIARLHADGSLDRTFQDELSGVNGPVNSVAVQSDGRVLIAGDFTVVNVLPAAGIARLWSSAEIPPRITNLNRSATTVNLIWDALPGRKYVVQYNDTLTASTWKELPGEVSASTSNTASKAHSAAGSANQRFYRVLLLP